MRQYYNLENTLSDSFFTDFQTSSRSPFRNTPLEESLKQVKKIIQHPIK